ncbi:MAG: cytochrome d ubiquinol oxidase subunit II [Brevibacillus sp.]|nr:cytochrome d ubiquinol oxidase subunit II [Brevibacillus sp.]
MTDTVIAITLLWIFVIIYSVAASFDFGAGFWSMVYLNHKQTKATSIANRYLSPSWEVTNVFIVLIVVGLVSFFPGATYKLGTVLLLPGSLVVLLILLRSAFMIFSHLVNKYDKALNIVSGVTGLIVPALLISVLPITQGGFIETADGAERLLLGDLILSPHGLSYIGLAVSSTLFLSSLLLADYSFVANEQRAFAVYRRDAMLLGPLTLLMAVLTFVTMEHAAPWLYDNLWRYLPWLIASAGCFFIGYTALLLPQQKRFLVHLPRIAVISIVVQYLLASYAYGAAHLPYIVYPDVTIESGFTHPNTFRALFASYLVGFAILTPGFLYFWRLFMTDNRYLRQ